MKKETIKFVKETGKDQIIGMIQSAVQNALAQTCGAVAGRY